MRRGDGGGSRQMRHCERQIVEMIVYHIELVRPAIYLVELGKDIGDRIGNSRVEPQPAFTAWNQIGTGTRIAAGKQSHLMAAADELFGKQ